jgi:manganese transport protein
VIWIYGDQEVNKLLIFSQVVLSMQLGFAIIPLIHFCSDKKTMGEYAIKPVVQVLAWIIAAILVSLNIKMLVGEAIDFFEKSDNVFWKAGIIAGGTLVAALFVFIVVQPIVGRSQKTERREKKAFN